MADGARTQMPSAVTITPPAGSVETHHGHIDPLSPENGDTRPATNGSSSYYQLNEKHPDIGLVEKSPTSSQGSGNIFIKTKQSVQDYIRVAASHTDSEGSMNPHTDGSSRPPRQPRPWRQTLIRFGPLSGLVGLCIAMASIIAALGILAGSNNAPTKNWSLEPSAYLAIFTAIANQSIRLVHIDQKYATVQGVAIAWWYRASRDSNVNLERLHHDWRAGTTLRGALTSGRHLGLLGIACIFSTLVAVDGPLLQKATSVVPAPYNDKFVTLNVTMAQELPHGWAGSWSRLDGVNETWSGIFNQTMPSSNGPIRNDIFASINQDFRKPIVLWESNLPWLGIVDGCPDACEATIRAPALAETSCSTQLIPVNYTAPVNIAPFTESGQYAEPLTSMAFSIQPSLLIDSGKERINVITAFETNSECVGTLNLTACTYDSAIGEYKVTIKNNAVSLSPGMPAIVALANNTYLGNEVGFYPGNFWSTLAGAVSISTLRYEAATWFGDIVVDGINEFRQPEYGSNNNIQQYSIPNDDTLGCPNFANARDDVIGGINSLMFYLGAWAVESTNSSYLLPRLDPGLPLNTTVTGQIIGTHNIYSTNFSWFIGAAVVEFACIMLVLPTYWGWWKLGRQTSFSPLEIAKAFEAPLLADYNSNSTGADIARAAKKGHIQVRYGEVRESLPGSPPQDWKKKVAFAVPDLVAYPQRNTRFDV